MKKKMPKFKSEDEEARFWATHSPLEYLSEFGAVKKPFKFDPALLHKAAEKTGGEKTVSHFTNR